MSDPTPTLLAPPAQILAQALIDLGLASNPLDQEPWPVYIQTLPPTPDELLSVSDTAGTFGGRYMATGEMVEFPGVQIRVRTPPTEYLRGWRKARELREALPRIRRRSVTVDGFTLTLISVTLTAPVAVMGQDPDTQRRQNFSLNARVTLSI